MGERAQLDDPMRINTPIFARLVLLLAMGSIAMLSFAATTAVISLGQQRQILQDPGVATLGPTNAQITVVEYFDYNCPYCRKLAPEIHALVERNHTVGVLFKEWPIFGGVSVYAARSALASQWQGKYLLAHEALIGAPRLSQEREVDDTLQKAGIDVLELKKALAVHGAQIDAILARNSTEARSLGIRGTPGLLVGRDVTTGIGDLASLESAVADARHGQ
jgi:protein-disulfide isomerase